LSEDSKEERSQAQKVFTLTPKIPIDMAATALHWFFAYK
jgi:hypothetical protein